jgi:micrococcal nuclease
MLGVDTPETVHPSKPVEFFGKEASGFTKTRLEGQTVYLAFDWDLRDSYQRLLAYVYLEDGTCHNAAIIQEGYGFAYITYAFQFEKEFSNLQRLAKEESKGLWR